MKIVLLTSSLGSGGAERVATMLCNAWSARGDTVTLIPTYSGGGQPFYRISEKVETIYLADVVGCTRKSLRSYALRLAALRTLIAERDPDVVISFLPNVNVAAIFSTCFLRIPLIICERSDPSTRSSFSPLEIYCRLTYRFADMLTVQTDAVASKARDIYPGLSRVRSIPNPLSESIATLREVADTPRKVLLSLGRLSSEKRVDRIIDAFFRVAPHFSDWDLHIYGDGSLRHALHSQIERLGLQERIFLKGRTNQPWDVMAGADAFVMNSAYEGFPNALLEAMGVGLPCIASDCPSGPGEISRYGQDALLVPLDGQEDLVAALTRVMGDAGFRRTLGRQARESVLSRFSLSSVIDSWDRLFSEVGAAP